MDKSDYKMLHKDKSAEELQQLLRATAEYIVAMPIETQVDLMIAQSKEAECDAIKEILEEAELQWTNYKKATDIFREELEARKEKAILHLPYTASYPGQIVLALLEENDALTFAELQNLCAEFIEISAEELQTLLDNLVTEETAARDENDAYRFLTFLDDDLFALDPLDWTRRRISKDLTFSKYENTIKTILESAADDPESGKHMRTPIASLGQYVEIFSQNKGRIPQSDLAEIQLSSLVEEGILQSFNYYYSHKLTFCPWLYYFKMFGEQKKENKK